MKYPLSFAYSAGLQAEQGATNLRTAVFYPGNTGPQAAMMSAQTGDIIAVNPTMYTQFAITLPRTIIVKSADPKGARYTFDVGGVTHPWRCIELGMGVGLSIQDGILQNDKMEYANDSGIWPTGGPYTLNMLRMLLRGLNNGVMIGDHREATVNITDCEAYDNGDYNGYTHNWYIGPVALLTVTGTWSHMVAKRGDPGVPDWWISQGHLFKCRAKVARFYGNRFTQERGESNRPLDLPNGGDVEVVGNLFECNANMQTNQGWGQALSYGVEEFPAASGGNPIGHTLHRLIFQQNTTVMHADPNMKKWLYIANTMPTEYSNVDNVYAGFNDYVQGDQAYVPPATANSLVPLTAMPGHAAFDFALTKPVAGSKAWATRAYKHPCSSVPRSDSFRGGVA